MFSGFSVKDGFVFWLLIVSGLVEPENVNYPQSNQNLVLLPLVWFGKINGFNLKLPQFKYIQIELSVVEFILSYKLDKQTKKIEI